MLKQKIKTKIVPILASLILILSSVPMQSFAANYTPAEREGIPLFKNTPGLNYNSFNNFIDGTGANAQKVEMPTEVGKTGDEREFALLHECPDGDKCSNPVWYQNGSGDILGDQYEHRRSFFDQWPNGATVGGKNSLDHGDEMKFMVYFHNNADDPFDGGTEGHIAKDVEIGISIPEFDYANEIKPFGFIDSDDATYRTNHLDPSTVILGPNGNPVHRITDDTVISSETPVNLKLKKDWVVMQLMDKQPGVAPEDQSSLFFGAVKACNNNVAEGAAGYYTNSVTVHPEGNTEAVTMNFCLKEMKDNLAIVKFDQIPGCFAYAGFLYFNAQVYQEPVCTDLNLNPKEDITEGDTVSYTVAPVDQFGNPFPGNVTWNNTTGGTWIEQSCTPGVDCDAGSPTLVTDGASTVQYSGGGSGEITISHENDPAGNCKEVINVYEDPKVCTEFSAVSIPFDQTIEVGQHAVLGVNGATNKGDFTEDDLVTWKTNAGILKTVDLIPEQSGSELTDIPATTIVVFTATSAGKNIIHVEYQGAEETPGECQASFFTVEEAPLNYCLDLDLIASNEDGSIINVVPLGDDLTKLEITPQFKTGEIPEGTLYEWSSLAGGGFFSKPGASPQNPLLTEATTVYFTGADVYEALISVKVATDQFTADQCREHILTEQEPPPVPVCRNLVIDAQSDDGAPFYTSENINITATAFDQFSNQMFIDINYNNDAGGEFTSLYHATGGAQPSVTVNDFSTTPNNETEVIFSGATQAGSVTISAVDDPLGACTQTIPILEAACVDLKITPAGPFTEDHEDVTLTVTAIDELGNIMEGPFYWESFSGGTFVETPCTDPEGCAPAEELVTLGNSVIFHNGTAASPAIKVSKIEVQQNFVIDGNANAIDLDKYKIGPSNPIKKDPIFVPKAPAGAFEPLSFGFGATPNFPALKNVKLYNDITNEEEQSLVDELSKLSDNELDKAGIDLVEGGISLEGPALDKELFEFETAPTSNIDDSPANSADDEEVFAAETAIYLEEEEEEDPILLLDLEDFKKNPQIFGPLVKIDPSLIIGDETPTLSPSGEGYPSDPYPDTSGRGDTPEKDILPALGDKLPLSDVCMATADIIAVSEDCVSLQMVFDPAPFDPSQDTKITLLGEFGTYTGGFQITAYKSDGTLADGVFDYGQAEKPNNPLKIIDTSVTIMYTGGSAGDAIIIEPLDENQPDSCSDRIRHIPDEDCQFFDLVTDPSPFDPEAPETAILLEGDLGDYDGPISYEANNRIKEGFEVPSKGVFYLEGQDPLTGTNPFVAENPDKKVFFTGGEAGDYISVDAVDSENPACLSNIASPVVGFCVDMTIEPTTIQEIIDNGGKITANAQGLFDTEITFEGSGTINCTIDSKVETLAGTIVEATCENVAQDSSFNIFVPGFEDNCSVNIEPEVQAVCEEITLDPPSIEEIVNKQCKVSATVNADFDGQVTFDASGDTTCTVDSDTVTDDGRVIEATCDACSLETTLNVFAPGFEDACNVTLHPPGTPICESISITPDSIEELENNSCELTTTITGDYDGDLTFEASEGVTCTVDSDTPTADGREIKATCTGCDNNTNLNVFAVGFEDACKVSMSPKPGGEGEGEGEGEGGGGGSRPFPPKVIKRVKSLDAPDSGFANVINVAAGSTVEYQIIIDSVSKLKSIELWDTIGGDGLIGGSIDGHIRFEPGSLSIENVSEATGNVIRLVEECEDDKDKKLCVEAGVPFELATKEVPFVIRNLKNSTQTTVITYRGTVESVITEESCQTSLAELHGCGEDFINSLRYNYTTFKDPYTKKNKDGGSARVVVVCPYILTKTAGDVFFEDQFDVGTTVDIGHCAPIKSTPGIIITPELPPIEVDVPEIPQTGPCSNLFPGKTAAQLTDEEKAELGACMQEAALEVAFPTHAACSLSNEDIDGNIEGLKNPIKSLSSSVCETKARVSDLWRWEYIRDAIEENKFKFAKWNNNITTPVITDFASQLATADNAQSGVFKYVGDKLTIGANNGFSQIAGNSGVHIIVEGDLEINSNIIYNDTSVNLGTSSPGDFPSLAFTVFGDIKVAPEVTQLDGIYMAIQDEESGEGGRIYSEIESDAQLIIVGSLIGDMQELIKNRTYTGDYSQGGGNVVIEYSERVHLNTPPGLSDWLDISIFKQKFGLEEL